MGTEPKYKVSPFPLSFFGGTALKFPGLNFHKWMGNANP